MVINQHRIIATEGVTVVGIVVIVITAVVVGASFVAFGIVPLFVAEVVHFCRGEGHQGLSFVLVW